MSERWRRSVRWAGMGLVLAMFLVIGGPPAQAEEATARPDAAGYFSQTEDPTSTAGAEAFAACQQFAPENQRGQCIDPATITGGTPGFPRKDNFVYIAQINGNPDAVGLVTLAGAMFTIPFGSVVTGLTLDFVVEDEPDVGSVNFDTEDPGLEFCLTTEGAAPQDGAPYDSRPATDCSVSATPKFLETVEGSGTNQETGEERPATLHEFRVDLLPMAKAWADGRPNHGVSIVPPAGAPQSYQAPIRGPGVAPDAMVLTIEFEAPPPPVVPQFTAPEDTGTQTFSEVSFGAGETVTRSEETPVFEVPEEPVTTDTAAPVRSAPQPNPSNPWWIFLGLPLGLGVLAALARGTAEPIELAGVQREGPVGRLMSRRTAAQGA